METVTVHLYYGHNVDSPIVVTNGNQLAAELDRIDEMSHLAGEPWMAALRDSAGRELALGLGAESSVVTWTDETDPERPYLFSYGEGTREQDLAFFYGDWSEFPSSALVPMQLARRAARDFMETGTRPDMRWQL